MRQWQKPSSVRSTTALSSVVSSPKKKPKAGSSFRIPPRKSRRKAKSSPLAPVIRDDAGKLQALDVKAGDRVLFGKWSGTEVKLDGEDLLIMKESDIMGVLG
jgi:chaperonin GroES